MIDTYNQHVHFDRKMILRKIDIYKGLDMEIGWKPTNTVNDLKAYVATKFGSSIVVLKLNGKRFDHLDKKLDELATQSNPVDNLYMVDIYGQWLVD